MPNLERITFHVLPGIRDSLAPLMENIRPSMVFHLATCFVAEHQVHQIPDLIETNILFGTQLLESMVAANVKRIINAGSHWQHAVPESVGYHPATLYAATKEAFENVLDYYCDATGMSAVTLTLFDSYGPGDHRPKFLNILANRPKDAPALALSPGEQQMNLVYIDDVVEALLCCAGILETLPSGHHRYMLGGVQSRSLREIVEEFERLTNVEAKVIWGARPYRIREIMKPWCAGVSLPGWHPRTTLEMGLRKMLHSLEEST